MTGRAGAHAAPLKAEILAVGSELLTPLRLDTNSLFITERLNEIGIEVRTKTVVGDAPQDLAAAFSSALARADLLFVTGGLGPTGDDVTREVVADTLGLPLVEDPEVLAHIQRRFRALGFPMPDANRRQAMVPRGAVPLPNPNGTAPGLWLESGMKRIALLPGPPRELKPIVEGLVRERLRPFAGPFVVRRRALRITGRGESQVDELAQPIYSQWMRATPPVTTTILAAAGEIELRLSTRAGSADEAGRILDRVTEELVAVLGPVIYSTDGRSLEQVVGDLLRERSLSIAVAESCTGGLLASRLTDVPGSSSYLERGVVCYSNRAKTELLGVSDTLLREHGAVSEPVGLAMAEGIRDRAGVDVGVGITGIAGPSGGTADKPVGTVIVAAAWGRSHRAQRLLFLGAREQVKFRATQAALDLVRRWLIEGPENRESV